MTDFSNFLAVNGLKRQEIADYLGVSGAFVSQVTAGNRPLPEDKLAKIKQNTNGWDVSMLTSSRGGKVSRLMSGIDIIPKRVVVKNALESEDKILVNYLEKKIEDKDRLIRELEKKIGMLEAKLELANKS